MKKKHICVPEIDIDRHANMVTVCPRQLNVELLRIVLFINDSNGRLRTHQQLNESPVATTTTFFEHILSMTLATVELISVCTCCKLISPPFLLLCQSTNQEPAFMLTDEAKRGAQSSFLQALQT